MQAVLRQRVHRFLPGAELIRRILVENRDSLVQILSAGDEGINFIKADAGVRIRFLRGFKGEFLK
jgi:hypothetical protein